MLFPKWNPLLSRSMDHCKEVNIIWGRSPHKFFLDLKRASGSFALRIFYLAGDLRWLRFDVASVNIQTGRGAVTPRARSGTLPCRPRASCLSPSSSPQRCRIMYGFPRPTNIRQASRLTHELTTVNRPS